MLLHCTEGFEDGVLALADELVSRGWPVTLLLEDPAQSVLLQVGAGSTLRTVSKRSARGVLRYLTSRWIFTTHSVFGNRRPPAKQVLVNIWHGEPPTKVTARFVEGLSGIGCTYAPVCSRLGRAYRAAAFGMSPLRVPVVGAPRNDRMLRADSAAIREALLGEEAGLPTLLWLPSFRAGRWRGERTRLDVAHEPHPGLPFPTAEVRRIDEWLVENGARLVVKPHPHDATSLAGQFRAIRVITGEDLERRGLTLYPALSAFDGLITDVSSVWVDYLLADKPMIFAFPDIDDYRRGRGLNLEPYEHWVPGPFVEDADGLVHALQDVVEGRDPMAEQRRLARLRFHQHTDDQSAARLLDELGLTAAASRTSRS